MCEILMFGTQFLSVVIIFFPFFFIIILTILFQRILEKAGILGGGWAC